MKRNVLILLAITVLTTVDVGCCSSCRKWLHRGSRCGTRTVAPATIGSPVALGTPYVAPQVPAPTMQMAAPTMVQPMQQQAMPQCAPQCVPQCIPQCPPQQCMPMCPPTCFDPCSDMCSPSGQGAWFGGYIDGDSSMEGETYMPGSETFVAPPGTSTITPGPAPATRSNYPEGEEKENE